MANKKMTTNEVLNQFRGEVAYLAHQDDTAIRTAFNDFVDQLHKEGKISDKIADNIEFKEGKNQREARLVQSHILSYYGLGDLREQVNTIMKYSLTGVVTEAKALEHMAEGASFLVHYEDINKFIKSVKDFKREYSNKENWDMYKYLIGKYGPKLLAK